MAGRCGVSIRSAASWSTSPVFRCGWSSRSTGGHGRDDVVLNDHLRQQAIEALGWTVVRFTNAEALAEPSRIDAAIRERAKTLGL